MKTLFKTYDQKSAYNKRAEYQTVYNVKFDLYHSGDGWRIVPVISKDTTPDEQAAGKIVPYIQKWYNAKSFASISDESGISIKDVLSGALWLVKNYPYMYTLSVTRQGNASGIYISQYAK